MFNACRIIVCNNFLLIYSPSSQYSVFTRKLHIGLPVRSSNCAPPRPHPSPNPNDSAPTAPRLRAWPRRLWRLGLVDFAPRFRLPYCFFFLILPLLLSVRGLRIKLQKCLGDGNSWLRPGWLRPCSDRSSRVFCRRTNHLELASR